MSSTVQLTTWDVTGTLFTGTTSGGFPLAAQGMLSAPDVVSTTSEINTHGLTQYAHVGGAPSNYKPTADQTFAYAQPFGGGHAGAPGVLHFSVFDENVAWHLLQVPDTAYTLGTDPTPQWYTPAQLGALPVLDSGGPTPDTSERTVDITFDSNGYLVLVFVADLIYTGGSWTISDSGLAVLANQDATHTQVAPFVEYDIVPDVGLPIWPLRQRQRTPVALRQRQLPQ